MGAVPFQPQAGWHWQSCTLSPCPGTCNPWWSHQPPSAACMPQGWTPADTLTTTTSGEACRTSKWSLAQIMNRNFCELHIIARRIGAPYDVARCEALWRIKIGTRRKVINHFDPGCTPRRCAVSRPLAALAPGGASAPPSTLALHTPGPWRSTAWGRSCTSLRAPPARTCTDE